jgi:ATP-binding cassette subfamily B (MDR/TAP) protein 10
MDEVLTDFYKSTFLGFSFPVAAGLLAATFCVGAACNAGKHSCLYVSFAAQADFDSGRAILMKLSGQRIVARVR